MKIGIPRGCVRLLDRMRSGQPSSGCLIVTQYMTWMAEQSILALDAWRSPRELLVLSLCWNLKEVGSNSVEGMPQQQDR